LEVLVAENKTKASAANPDAYIAAIADESRRKDCSTLIALMSKATKQPPVMWGTAIVGFGIHNYQLAGGKLGQICSVGFSSRKGDISIYGVTRSEGAEQLLAKLGKHKLGKGCLYVNRLADIDTKVLEKLVVQAFRSKHA
jgi:hypothetical protein